MNGYELTRRYFNWAFENPELANTNAAAVYFFLIDLWNRNGGELKPRFTFSKQTCKDALGIKDIRTLNAGFDVLVKNGFIIIHREAKNQNTSWILSLAYAKNAQADVSALDRANVLADVVAHASADVSAHTPVIEQYNNETNKPLNNKEGVTPPTPPAKEKKIELDFSFLDEIENLPFKDVFREWWVYRVKEKKKPFKTQTTLQKAFDYMVDLSGNSPEIAKKIVNQAIANTWQGLQPLKNDNNTGKITANEGGGSGHQNAGRNANGLAGSNPNPLNLDSGRTDYRNQFTILNTRKKDSGGAEPTQ